MLGMLFPYWLHHWQVQLFPNNILGCVYTGNVVRGYNVYRQYIQINISRCVGIIKLKVTKVVEEVFSHTTCVVVYISIYFF